MDFQMNKPPQKHLSSDHNKNYWVQHFLNSYGIRIFKNAISQYIYWPSHNYPLRRCPLYLSVHSLRSPHLNFWFIFTFTKCLLSNTKCMWQMCHRLTNEHIHSFGVNAWKTNDQTWTLHYNFPITVCVRGHVASKWNEIVVYYYYNKYICVAH